MRILILVGCALILPPYGPARAEVRPLGNELAVAVEGDDARAVRRLLRDGADPNTRACGGLPVLLLATRVNGARAQDQSEIMRALVDHGADVNFRGVSEETPLIWAVRNQNRQLARNLLNHGADPNQPGRDVRDPAMCSVPDPIQTTPLRTAVRGGSASMLELLMNHEANPNEGGWTALTEAVDARKPALVRWLLKHGARANVRTVTGVTPLHRAADVSQPEIVQLLLSYGAAVDPVARWGETPLMLAAYAGDVRTVAVLLRAGARTDARDGQGRTPLMWAAMRGRVDAVRVLLRHGADATTRDADGKSAAEHAGRLVQTVLDARKPGAFSLLFGNRPPKVSDARRRFEAIVHLLSAATPFHQAGPVE